MTKLIPQSPSTHLPYASKHVYDMHPSSTAAIAPIVVWPLPNRVLLRTLTSAQDVSAAVPGGRTRGRSRRELPW